jgi:hypothetical protein
MELLQLVQADGLQTKKAASTNGGEYHCPCPGCGGRDRFIIWDKKSRYLCRRCGKKGDVIQYLRDFHGLSYLGACNHLKIQPVQRVALRNQGQNVFEPKSSSFPPLLWRQKASELIEKCQQSLFSTPYGIQLFLKRGFSVKMMKEYQVGWNPQTLWLAREEWGLEPVEGKRLWIPKGLVLPTFDLDTGEPIKLKIRRDGWEESMELPKYVEVCGGMQTPSRFGVAESKPIMIVESEFDAMLVQKFAGDLIGCMALGGASKRPDSQAHQLLMNAPMILFSLDVDSAGAIAYQWWRKMYPHLKLWLPPIGKSPGEAYEKGIDLHEWVKMGLY